MWVPVVALPVTPVAVVSPVQRAIRQGKADKDKGRGRRDAQGRFELGDRRDVPSGDPAAATSSVAVLSALLDLPRGG